jgi:peptidoglycan/LPS O-acetylase OafA/YrhL
LQDRREIQSHTAIRGIAAFLVVAYHLQFDDNLLGVETATTFFKRSYLFVDLFFILSWFIISYVNQADRGEPLTRDAIVRFMKKRIIRLYPLVFFCLVYLLVFRATVSLAYVALAHRPPFEWTPASLAVLLGQATMTNAWLPLHTDWNIPSWSISAEIFAYLLFPVFIVARIVWPVLTWVVCTLMIGGFYAAAVAHGNLDITLVWSPFRCLAGFLIGVIIYFARHRIERLPMAILSILQVTSAIAVVAVLCLPVNDVWVIPAFGALVAATWTDRGLLSRALRTRASKTLGHWSFSIYLNHVPVIAILGFVWFRIAPRLGIDGDAGRIAWIVLVYAVVLLVSRWTYLHVELSAQAALTRRFVTRRAEGCNAVPAKE